RLLITRGCESGGTAVFAIPGVGEFVGKQIGVHLALVFVDVGALRDTVVARLMVLQSEVSDVVTQGDQEVITVVVTRAEEGSGFIDQPFVIADGFVRDLDSGCAVSSQIDEVGTLRGRGNWNLAEIFSGKHRRIYQHLEGYRFEADVAGVL